MSPPVVILPLNQELMDANIGVEELQQFQHVDNVVELQLQPVSPAPPSTTVSVDTSFFDKVNTMMETFNKFVPFLSQLGSDRRSLTAGPSDIVSPNPVARVPGTAPQSPDVAPGPSSASLEPRASCSGLHHRDDKVANPRGQPNKGDQPSGSRHASQPPSPSHQERLRDQLEDVHRQLSHTREIVDFYRAHGRVPPDQSQDDLENLQAQYAQISIALEESLYVASSHRRGPPPIESPLHLVPLPLVLIRHRFVDIAAQTGLGPLRMTARVRETPSVVILAPVAVRMNVMRNEPFLATPLPTGEGPVIGSCLLADI